MSTYLFGDIQGCFITFQSLLTKIQFDCKRDNAILLGDAINRGPDSLPMLRYIVKHQSCISLVLGNHEIFAIALMLKAISNSRPHTLQALLAAPDAPELCEWLRRQPLIVQRELNIFVHAGILPAISLKLAHEHGDLVHQKLAGDRATQFLQEYFEQRTVDLASCTTKKLTAKLALAYFTLLRTCSSKDSMDLSYSGGLAEAPSTLIPWFKLRDDGPHKIYFGHWAALGVYHYKNYYCLDSGCVWGRQLSALRLEDHVLFQVDNAELTR